MRYPFRIGLWVVLIALFIAFYKVFQAEPAAGQHATRAAPQPELWVTVVTQWLPLFFIFIAFLLFLRFAQRANAQTQEGARLLGSGRYLAALEIFAAFQQKNPKNLVASHNVAVAQLALWRISDAQRTVQQLVKRAKPGQLEALASVHAVISAVAGDVAAAKGLVELPKAKLDAKHYALARASIACRTGDFAAGVIELDKFEIKQLGGFMAGIAQALRSWAAEQTTGQSRPVDRVLVFGEAGTEGLKAAWPELSQAVARAPVA